MATPMYKDNLAPKTVDRFYKNGFFVFILVFTSFVSAEYTSVFYAAIVLFCLFFTGRKNNINNLFLWIAPFFCLLILGGLQAHENYLDEVVKDVWYLFKVMAAVSAGYCFAIYFASIRDFLRSILAASFILATLHLLQLAISFRGGYSLMDLRDEVGSGYFVVVIGLGLLLGRPRFDLFFDISKTRYWLLTIICFFSVAATASRTNIVSVVLMVFIFRGWVGLNSKTFFSMFFCVVFGFLAAGWIESDQNDLDLFSKFTRSITEITIADYDDIRDINLNWRGFESHQAYRSFQDGSLVSQLFGQGFGALVDLGLYMQLGEDERRYIPHLHNGYLYVLIKYGAFGILAYVFFMCRAIVVGVARFSSWDVQEKINCLMISSLGWVFLFSSIVVTGLFNKHIFDPILVVFGVAIYFYNNSNRAQR